MVVYCSLKVNIYIYIYIISCCVHTSQNILIFSFLFFFLHSMPHLYLSIFLCCLIFPLLSSSQIFFFFFSIFFSLSSRIFLYCVRVSSFAMWVWVWVWWVIIFVVMPWVWWVINFVGHAVGVGDRVRGCGGWVMPWGLWFLADLGLLG